MNRIDRFIADCPSFEEFRNRTGALPLTMDRGEAFERATYLYLRGPGGAGGPGGVGGAGRPRGSAARVVLAGPAALAGQPASVPRDSFRRHLLRAFPHLRR
jgi:hypothetical protein